MRLGLIGAAAMVLALTWMACGEDGATGAACTTDEDCRTGEICHPGAGLCVQTCEIGGDCPPSAKTCAELSATDSRRICKCVTDELCAGGATTGSTAICSTEFDICMTKCGSNVDCPSGTACETSTGQCLRTVGAACSTTAPAPDVCSYGQFCGSGSTCEAVPPATCQNFTVSGHGTSWSAASNSGPIIYEISQVGGFPAAATGCQPGQKLARVNVRAYRTSDTFPVGDPQAIRMELHYVKTNGTEATTQEKPFVFPSSYSVSNNARNVEFDLGFCPPDTIGQFTAGLHFADGNEICIVVQ